MTAVTILGAATLLAWLTRTGFSRTTAAISIGLLPLLVLAAPSRRELGLTILVETPIVWMLLVRLQVNGWAALTSCGLVNSLTQPLLHLALAHLPNQGVAQWRLAVAGGELIVWIAEALLYWACLADLQRAPHAIPKALGVSLAANAVSAAVGLALPI